MKRRLTILFATLCCLAAFIPSRAQSPSDRRSAFEVPFDFVVHGKRLPAGSYTVERVDRGNPGVLVIRDGNGSAKRVFLTQGVESGGEVILSALVFTRYGDQYFLFRVWTGGGRNGRQLPRGDAERELLRSGRGPALVALTK